MKKLLSNASSNPKTRKLLDEFGYEAVIHHMTPDRLADGKRTVCAWSTAGCRAMCLNTSGRSQVKGELTADNLSMYMIHRSRMGKTLEFLDDRQGYADRLVSELVNLEARAIKKGYTPVARLNDTSDIPWELYIDMEMLPNVRFYDYTNSERRMRSSLSRMPASCPVWADNYDLTYSYSEKTTPDVVDSLIMDGGNVAVVFRKDIPDTFMGHKVINGIEHDFRFRDEKGCIVGLTARGRAKHDKSGFVIG